MEQQAEQMLRTQAARLEHPEEKARIEMHVHETRAQQKLVARCIELLGEKLFSSGTLPQG
jgi:ferritin-like metal-binding protein YciE